MDFHRTFKTYKRFICLNTILAILAVVFLINTLINHHLFYLLLCFLTLLLTFLTINRTCKFVTLPAPDQTTAHKLFDHYSKALINWILLAS